MSRYAEVADVQARIPAQMCTLGTDSQPPQSEVEVWLDATSAWLDASLRWKYMVPVTDPTDRNTLRMLCSMLVASQVWSVIGGHTAQVPGNGPLLRKDALLLLAYDERSGRSNLVLPNTPLAETGEATVADPEGSFTDPDTDGVPRFFELGRELW